MSTSIEKDEKKEHLTMEERLSTVGSRIDSLIALSAETKTLLSNKFKEKKELSGEALDELKSTMDKAWCDVNHAWEEAKAGTKKAADKLHPEHKDCSK
jgi:hypothetical protein